MIWAERLLQVSLPSGLAKNCYPCVESLYCHLQLTVSPSPTQRGQRERRLARYTGWLGPPEWEGWGVKLGYCSPHPFCTSAPSCLLLFLHKLSHSAGSWLQGWPRVQVSFLPSTMNKSYRKWRYHGAGQSWELSEPETPPSVVPGCWHPGSAASAGSVLVCDTHVNPSPSACLSGRLPCASYVFPSSEEDLTPWELPWGPLSASPTKSSTAVGRTVCASQESSHHKSPLGQFLSFSTLCTFRSHPTSYLRG